MSPHAMTSIRQELDDREEIAATRNSLEKLAEKLESSLLPSGTGTTSSSGNAMQLRQLRAMLQQKKEEMTKAHSGVGDKAPEKKNIHSNDQWQGEAQTASSAGGAPDQMQDGFSVLQDRLSAAENAQTALSRQMAQILSARMRQPDTSRIDAHISTLRTEIARDTDTRLNGLEATLKERIKQCESRSADAINEMGTQVARITERLQEDQRAALASMQQTMATMRTEHEEKLSEVFARLEQSLQDARRHSQNAVDPLKSTVSSLARRLDAVDKAISESASPHEAPRGRSTDSPTSTTPSSEEKPSHSHHRYTPDQSHQGQAAPPNPAAPQPPRYAMHHQSLPPDGGQRYSTPGIIPEFAHDPRIHERRMQDQMIKSARQSVQSVDIDHNVRNVSTFNGLLEKQRGKLPLMAASALALAVAGGGALTMMRSKPDTLKDTAAAESESDLAVDQAARDATTSSSAQSDPSSDAAASIGQTETIALQATRIEPLYPESLQKAATTAQTTGLDARSLYKQGIEHLDEGEKILGAERLTSAANAGLAIAQYRLAKLYEKGEGVPRSISTAREWTKKAAGNGNVSAMHDLAVFYAQGDGGLQNYALAAEWFERAASHGLVDSQYNLGVLYEKGQGIPRDLAKATFWYMRAGMSGDADGARRAQELARQANWLDMPAIESQARAFVAKTRDPVANDPSVTSTSQSPTAAPSLIADAQRLLTELGYDPGPADGISGSRTRRSIQSFQIAYRMTPTGVITPELVTKMRTALIEAQR